MTYHLFGAVLTPHGVASNNRGENAGNVSSLQKLLRKGEIHTTVSAEAIRYAMREYWTANDATLNRAIDDDGNSSWTDLSFESWADNVDDDLLGFMHPKKETTKRRGRLEITRAISTRPWTGDLMFNVASVGSHPSANKNPIPYGVEVHSTRYQYVFALTPTRLGKPRRAFLALDAVQNLTRVAGNHSRYLYEFAPEAVVLRYTHDPVPRMMYLFDEDEFGGVSSAKLLHAVQSGDIDGEEVVVAGEPVAELGAQLASLGATYHPGVKAAFADIRKRVEATL